MRLSWSSDESSWTLRLRLDTDDSLRGNGQDNAPVSLVTNECTVTLPSPIDEPHPDLLAVAALLIARPWVGSRATFDRPISSTLAEALHHTLGISAGPVDDALRGRDAQDHVGLAYSGGVDSIATSELLPSSAPRLHLQRVKHPRIPNRVSLAGATAMAQLAREAERRGLPVAIIQSDLEYLCLPRPQCPTWPAIGIAGVLLADHYRLGALAYGSTLEFVYLSGGRRFTGNGPGGWKRVLSAVGLPLCRPVAGLTEVGTTIVASGSRLADLARSCARGTSGQPCLSCAKCARKELLSAASERRDIHPAIRRRLQPGSRAARDLDQLPPLYLQNSVEYVLARIPDLRGTILQDLAERIDATVESTSWNERYYGPALADEVPPRFRPQIEAELRRRFQWMDEDDIKIVETWDGAGRMR